MNHSIKVGFSFGLTSGIITTLGLMVGLYSSTNSRIVVLGGILTIAVSDAFSDALGIHISEESSNEHSNKEIWQSTLSTFLSKFVFASLFFIPILTLELKSAIITSIIIGLLLLGIFSYIIAKEENSRPWKVIGEHITIAVTVIILTSFLGTFISNYFK